MEFLSCLMQEGCAARNAWRGSEPRLSCSPAGLLFYLIALILLT